MEIAPIIGNLVIGFVGGIAALWGQQHLLWKPQRRIELRRAVYERALDAIARYEVDALDPEFQRTEREKPGDLRHAVAMRLETRILMQRARLEVEAFFPTATADAYKTALDTPISIDRNPNTDFTQRSIAAAKLMAADIGLMDDSALTRWFNR